MRHNILIVDDEQLIRQGLRARIEYLGIDVDEIFEAENGLMALRLQEEHPIDVVITDIRMPDMDGLELIQEMQKKNNQIKFVVLSGYAEFSYAETAIRLGVKAYLLKPVSNDDLKAAFDKAYKEMEQTASVRQEVQMKKRMDREKQVYQQEKALNALFSSQEAGAVTREQLCKLCGYDEKMWAGGAESVLYLAILHINKESFEHQRFRPVDHELVRFMIRNIFEEIQAPCEKLLVNSLSDTRQMYGIFIGDDKKKLRMEVERIYLRMRSVLEKKMGNTTMGQHWYQLLDEIENRQNRYMMCLKDNENGIDLITVFFRMVNDEKVFRRVPGVLMKKHSDNNVKDIYSFGAVIYVAERTLLVGIQRYFENEPEQRKEVRTYKKKMIEALKAEEILLVDNSKANTKKKNGKRFYEIDYKRLKYFCQLQDAK